MIFSSISNSALGSGEQSDYEYINTPYLFQYYNLQNMQFHSQSFFLRFTYNDLRRIMYCWDLVLFNIESRLFSYTFNIFCPFYIIFHFLILPLISHVIISFLNFFLTFKYIILSFTFHFPALFYVLHVFYLLIYLFYSLILTFMFRASCQEWGQCEVSSLKRRS